MSTNMAETVRTETDSGLNSGDQNGGNSMKREEIRKRGLLPDGERDGSTKGLF
jgi:hypothetical protein